MNLDAGQATAALPREALSGVGGGTAKGEIILFQGMGMATAELGVGTLAA
ncbi:hypothetical protein ACFQH5_05710 [Halomonas salifodinae]|uniref:Uncharacterized protein n=1 Tax=Halomonas salifodinae TaxID=438745 RepID=A0ABW2EVU2_9GAMM